MKIDVSWKWIKLMFIFTLITLSSIGWLYLFNRYHDLVKKIPVEGAFVYYLCFSFLWLLLFFTVSLCLKKLNKKITIVIFTLAAILPFISLGIMAISKMMYGDMYYLLAIMMPVGCLIHTLEYRARKA